MIQDFFNTIYATGSDFTNSFRLLSSLKLPPLNDKLNIDSAISDYLKLIIQQCCPFEEYKQSLKPKFPPEYIFILLHKILLFYLKLFLKVHLKNWRK